MGESRPWTRTEQVQTTLTIEQRKRLDACAMRLDRSRADLIRQLILDGLEERRHR